MKTVGVFEAKTRFSALVADAERGITTIVTKNGKPVAEVGPVRGDSSKRRKGVLQRIEVLRKRFGLKNINWRELINEDREIW